MSDRHAFEKQLTEAADKLKSVMEHPLLSEGDRNTSISEVDWAVERILLAYKHMEAKKCSA